MGDIWAADHRLAKVRPKSIVNLLTMRVPPSFDANVITCIVIISVLQLLLH